jgi:predicted HNH restriction endonuclease
MYCFVGINESNPANGTLLKNLDRIYGAHPTDHATDTDATSVPEASSSMEFDPEWREGDAKMRHHLSIERCSKAANTAKDIARSRTGFIHCEACNVSTAKLYGYELIDAHHIIPLADTKGMSRKPSAGDFAMLCPTCHRAVHRELSSGAIGKEAIAKVKAKIK